MVVNYSCKDVIMIRLDVSARLGAVQRLLTQMTLRNAQLQMQLSHSCHQLTLMFRRKEMLPQDPVMLLSYINTQLRDNYSSLDALIGGLGITKEELDEAIKKLEAIDYRYDDALNQFK